jgi:hypothetical protein
MSQGKDNELRDGRPDYSLSPSRKHVKVPRQARVVCGVSVTVCVLGLMGVQFTQVQNDPDSYY